MDDVATDLYTSMRDLKSCVNLFEDLFKKKHNESLNTLVFIIF
jgi:hypothetical protein